MGHFYSYDGTKIHENGLADAVVDVYVSDDVFDVAVIGAKAKLLVYVSSIAIHDNTSQTTNKISTVFCKFSKWQKTVEINLRRANLTT